MIRINGDGRIIGYVLEETDTLADAAATMNCTTIQLMKLIEKLKEMEWDGKDKWAFMDTISDMPTIDIVHCSECIWMKKNGFCIHPKQCGYRDNDWFCADGERRTE